MRSSLNHQSNFRKCDLFVTKKRSLYFIYRLRNEIRKNRVTCIFIFKPCLPTNLIALKKRAQFSLCSLRILYLDCGLCYPNNPRNGIFLNVAHILYTHIVQPLGLPAQCLQCSPGTFAPFSITIKNPAQLLIGTITPLG